MIRIQNLSKQFGSFVALNNLDLHVKRGEVFCFLGPNGAGKTTTIKLITGLLQPTSGSIHIAGIDKAKDPMAAKRILGYVPDMPFLYDRLTPPEFFQFTGDLYDLPRSMVSYELEKQFTLFGLNEHRKTLIKDLSHGMRQRLIYASTLLHQPDVLLIDEPLVGLDPYTIRLIKDLLKDYARTGKTVFLTTHILALAQDVGDRIGIINHGKMIALGSLDELIADSSQASDLEELFLDLTAKEENCPT